MRVRTFTLSLAAAIALADGSIVTLALPDILRELHTTVEGVAAVIGVYTVVLALVLVGFGRAVESRGPRVLGAAGFGVMAAASVAASTSGDLTGLLIARGAQALGGAAGLLAAFALVRGGEPSGRRSWLGAAVLGTAIGPALGGALTQLFSWQAIFIFQAPVAALAALASASAPRRAGAPRTTPADRATPFPLRPALALALASAALSGVLFVLVLLLVAGWSVSPLRAAAVVTTVPLAAIAGAWIRGDPRVRAAAGCALIGGGVLALAWLPDAHSAWTLVPQALAGVGLGLALVALGGELLPERRPYDAGRVLAVRHAGIAVALALIAPVVAHQLTVSTERAREQGVSLVLDARLPPQDKLAVAPVLLRGVDTKDPREGLRNAVARERARFSGTDLATYDRLGSRADQVLTSAVASAFHGAFLIAGGLALLGALVIAPWGAVASTRLAALGVAGALAAAVPGAYGALHAAIAPAPVKLLPPCKPHPLPHGGGVTGILQDRALRLLDSTACRFHATREELVLALASDKDARRFKARHGFDPRTLRGFLGGLIRGGG
jgi:hypothetical protein